MLKSYKTEINPTKEQIDLINKTIGTCRFIYNFYLAHNKEAYERDKSFVSGYDFSKWINHEFLHDNIEYSWIKDVSSKSVKRSIMNADMAFKKFFKGQSKFPRFKKKNRSDVKMYFVKNNVKDLLCERHRIKIPKLGWVHLKEKGYIPTNVLIKSGTISKKAGRYYISVIIETEEVNKPQLNEFGIGIDLGITDFAICSNGVTYKNINKSKRVKSLEKQLRREQRCLSRKYEDLKRKETTRKNIDKQIVKVQRLYQRLHNIRNDYQNKCVSEIVKTKPSYITIEDLNVKGMMKNRYLSKAVAQEGFYTFRTKLTNKCNELGIELRIADRWYPSSKTCHNCGNIKGNLKLSDRTYTCDCGYSEDRDYNASINLRDVVTYKLA